jgi:hypothetical protein
MSLHAIHEETGVQVSAENLVFNPEWMNKQKDKWIMPDVEILNLQEIRKENIIPYCSFVKPHIRDDFRVRGHFRIIDERVITQSPENESEEHKLAKTEIYYKIWANEISFDIGGKEYYPKDLGEFDVFIEKGIGAKRADVLLILKNTHPIIGNGIVVEVQLSSQSIEKTDLRSYDRALQGYSCVWLFDRHFSSTGLINTKLKVAVYQEVLERYSQAVNNQQAEQIALYSSFLNKNIQEFNKQNEILESKMAYLKRQTDETIGNFRQKLQIELKNDLSPEKEKMKAELKTELDFYLGQIMTSANENKKKAQEMILTQEKRLKEDYDKAVEGMKLTLKNLTTEKFNQEIEKVCNRIWVGDDIKDEIKKVVQDSLHKRKEEVVKIAEEVAKESVKEIQEKNIEEEIQKKVQQHIDYRVNQFDRAMWDAIDRKINSVINKENLGDKWEKSEQ